MSIQGAIFDMDGTLLDSMEAWATAGERYLMARGLTPIGGQADSLMYQTWEGITAHFRKTYGVDDSHEQIAEHLRGEVAAYYCTAARARDGVQELLQALRAAGVKMCVATATDRALAEPLLERLGLRSYFEAIFTCSEVGAGKTEPRVYDASRTFMRTPRESTWVFEDASYAAETAKAAGYPVCGVYDRFETRPERLRAAADVYLPSYRQRERLPFWKEVLENGAGS